MPGIRSDRVVRTPAPAMPSRVEAQLARRLSYYAMRPAEIEERLAELDREWPVERVLQAQAATLSLGGLVLGLALDRRWFALPVAIAGVLLQHAMLGGGPPSAVLRRTGARGAREIAQERYALKALRGDFRDLAPAGARQPALELRGVAEPGSPAAGAMHDRAAGALAAARR